MSRPELAGGFAVPTTATVSGHIEDHYVRRVRALPEASQRLMLLAAADPTGDGPLLRRSAQDAWHRTGRCVPWPTRRSCSRSVPACGSATRWCDRPRIAPPRHRSGERLTARSRRRPTPRPTRTIAPGTRRTRRRDPTLRSRPSSSAAAARAQARGGLAAAAAFLERSAILTPDTAMRVERRLAAAQANLQAGAFDAASALLAKAEFEATDEFAHARVELLRGRVGVGIKRGQRSPAPAPEGRKAARTVGCGPRSPDLPRCVGCRAVRRAPRQSWWRRGGGVSGGKVRASAAPTDGPVRRAARRPRNARHRQPRRSGADASASTERVAH